LIEDSGGFYPGIGSGLDFVKKNGNGELEFVAISDRGPNFSIINNDHQIIAFKDDFSPKIVKIIISNKTNKAKITEFMDISYEGRAITGINSNKNNLDEEMYDKNFNRIKSHFGLDTESIAVLKTGGYIVGDEYYPSINILNKSGEIVKRLIPGNGLPEIFKYRGFNRGFESVTVSPNGKIFAMLEGVLNINDDSNKNSKLIRLLEIDLISGVSKTYAYPFDYDKYKNSSKVKIGEIAALDNENFLVVEQGPGVDSKYRNILYKINIKEAMDISDVKLQNGKELEFGSHKDLSNIRFISKKAILNPRDYGWRDDKLEGLTVIDNNSIAISNDNDFAITGYDAVEEKCNKENNKICKTAVARTDRTKEETNLWIFKFKSKITS